VGVPSWLVLSPGERGYIVGREMGRAVKRWPKGQAFDTVDYPPNARAYLVMAMVRREYGDIVTGWHTLDRASATRMPLKQARNYASASNGWVEPA